MNTTKRPCRHEVKVPDPKPRRRLRRWTRPPSLSPARPGPQGSPFKITVRQQEHAETLAGEAHRSRRRREITVPEHRATILSPEVTTGVLGTSPAGSDAGAALATTGTAAELAAASISANTQRAFAGVMRRLQDHLYSAPLTDASLATYLSTLFEAGRSPATASMVVAIMRFQTRPTGSESPVGPRTDRGFAAPGRLPACSGLKPTLPLPATVAPPFTDCATPPSSP